MNTKVGVGVAIIDYVDGKAHVLLGKRKGSHGEGEWAFPGGHMEYMESFEDAAHRELIEEIGPSVSVTNMEVCSVTNLKSYAPKHYIDIGMTCRFISGDIKTMEPDKVESWQWVAIDQLHKLKLFATVLNTVEAALSDDFLRYGTSQVYDF